MDYSTKVWLLALKNNHMHIAIPLLIWVLSLVLYYRKLKREELAISDVVGWVVGKLSYLDFLSFMFPAFFITQFYQNLIISGITWFDKILNLFIMACIFFGIDVFPRLLCWIWVEAGKKKLS